MPDSTSTAVIAALAGGVGVFLGAWLTQHGRREERRQEQQRADADVLGPVMAFLAETEPEGLGISIHSTTMVKQMSELGIRADGIYGSLLVLYAGHPSAQVSDLARELAVASRQAFKSTSFFIYDLIGRSGGDTRAQTKKDPEHARKLADDLLEEIARYGRRRPRRWRIPVRRPTGPIARPEDLVTHVTTCRPRDGNVVTPKDG
ncbi:MAG TPA: hypothetical protein VFI46_04685 [Jiangellaceae bacterium]|nr:hypothetical protein [Jiangellaceae bacterium]